MLELLLNADLFTPAPRGRRHLLVAAGRIAWIGAEEPELGGGLEIARIDLEGRRVVPGLVDGHVHPTGGGGESGFASRVPPLALSAITRGGTTTVVGLLGTDDLTRGPAELLATTRALREEGLGAWCWTGGYHLPPATVTGSVGGDIVHLDPVVGVGEVAVSDHRSSQPEPADLRRLAAEAHVAGMIANKAGIVHLHMGDGRAALEPVRQALAGSELPPAVFHPTHVNRREALFEEALELAGGGTPIDVTAAPDDAAEAVDAADAVARFLDQGLPIERLTVSSDAGGCLPVFDGTGRIVRSEVGRPGTLADCLAALVAAGRPLEAVLPAFTESPARLLRLPGKGALVPGADADLVVLDDRGRATDVLAGGRWHLRDGQVRVEGRFERPADG